MDVPAQVTLTPGKSRLTVAVNPAVRGARITLQRLSGKRWVTVTSKALPSTGRVTFTKLNRALTYRVLVPASDRTVPVTTPNVRVR